MNIGIDIDGTLDAFPREFQSMMSAFTAAGFHVYIITGVDGKAEPTQDDIDAKRTYLTGLGVGRDVYYELVVCPEPHDTNKAKAIQDNDIRILFDNTVANVKAAKPYCAALLLWNAKKKK